MYLRKYYCSKQFENYSTNPKLIKNKLANKKIYIAVLSITQLIEKNYNSNFVIIN